MNADDMVFPLPKNLLEDELGLSVRDHIAIQAMNGILAALNGIDAEPDCDLAKEAYGMADAMILQSEKK